MVPPTGVSDRPSIESQLRLIAAREEFRRPRWARELSAFTHDVLKNEYQLAVSALIERVESGSSDVTPLRASVSNDLSRWPAAHDTLDGILRRYEVEMSPTLIIGTITAEREVREADSRHLQELRERVDDTWRDTASRAVREVRERLDGASCVYDRLRPLVEQAEHLTRDDLVTSLNDLIELRSSLRALSESCRLLKRSIPAPA